MARLLFYRIGRPQPEESGGRCRSAFHPDSQTGAEWMSRRAAAPDRSEVGTYTPVPYAALHRPTRLPGVRGHASDDIAGSVTEPPVVPGLLTFAKAR